jgi:hypothetical protein
VPPCSHLHSTNILNVYLIDAARGSTVLTAYSTASRRPLISLLWGPQFLARTQLPCTPRRALGVGFLGAFQLPHRLVAETRNDPVPRPLGPEIPNTNPSKPADSHHKRCTDKLQGLYATSCTTSILLSHNLRGEVAHHLRISFVGKSTAR